jgi:hypothetical protein
MSNKNESSEERGNGDKNDADRPREPQTGQSQDALRHQQDAAHHKGRRTPQPDAADSKVDQRPQEE